MMRAKYRNALLAGSVLLVLVLPFACTHVKTMTPEILVHISRGDAPAGNVGVTLKSKSAWYGRFKDIRGSTNPDGIVQFDRVRKRTLVLTLPHQPVIRYEVWIDEYQGESVLIWDYTKKDYKAEISLPHLVNIGSRDGVEYSINGGTLSLRVDLSELMKVVEPEVPGGDPSGVPE